MGWQHHIPVTVLMQVRHWRAAPFRGLTHDPDKAARVAARLPRATQIYGILFTPRTGSSRLTEILKQTGALGQPGECFNPLFVPKIARTYNADGPERYVDALLRHRASGPVFGFEATIDQIDDTFGSVDAFAGLVNPDRLVWLIREDIVAQAVSISRMVQTRVGHDTGLSGHERTTTDVAFHYDARHIGHRAEAVRWRERRTEDYLIRAHRPTLRTSYERLAGLSPGRVAALIADHVGVTLPDGIRYATTHRKLGTDKSTEFAERFRAENRAFVARLEAEREPLLAQIGAVAP